MSTYNLKLELKQLVDYLNSSKNPYVFPEYILEEIYTILHLNKLKFIILRGVSGIGKTLLIKILSKLIYREQYFKYYLNYNILPDYKDNIILSPDLKSFLLTAFSDPENLYFLHIEKGDYYIIDKYLTSLLNIIENEEDITIQGTTLKPKNNILISLDISENEYTNLISSDVLDRGFVINFLDVEFSLLEAKLNYLYKDKLQEEYISKLLNLLYEMYKLLKPYNLHFAYRTIYQSFEYVYNYLKINSFTKEDFNTALDELILSKILVKIKGDHKISSLVRKLRDLIKDNISQESKSFKVISKIISISTKTNTFNFFNYNYE